VYVGVLIAFLIGFYYTIRETRGLTVEEASMVFESASERERKLQAEREINSRAVVEEDETKPRCRTVIKEADGDS
jgi:hypothetical protein